LSDLNPQNQDLSFHKSVSPEEQKEILAAIDQMVAETKQGAPRSTGLLEGARSGLAFPLAINILAVLAVGASLFLSNRLFEQRQVSITEETRFYLSAEGRLLEEMKRESEQKLAAKDEEIGRIQSELADLDRQSMEMAANMEATISAKETALRREMEAALEQERQRLAAQGTSTEDIEAQVKALQDQILASNNQALESFRRESEVALETQRKELEQTIALNQSLLDQANAEKIRLAAERLEREAELTSQFQEEKAVLEAQTRQARAQLATLAETQEQQRLLQDQVNGSYQAVMEQVAARRYPQALEGINNLRNLLTSEEVKKIPSFSQRQGVDLFLLDTLKADVEGRMGRAGADTASLLAAAERLMAAEELAGRGEAALAEGDIPGARTYYANALERLPVLARGLSDLESRDRTARQEAVSQALQQGRSLMASGQTDAAAEQYRRALQTAGEESEELTRAGVTELQALYDTRTAALSTAARDEAARLQREFEAEKRQLQQEQQNILALARREYDAALAREKQAAETALATGKAAAAAAEQEFQIELAMKEAALEELSAQAARTEEALAEANRRVSGAAAEVDDLTARQNALEEITFRYNNLKVRLDRLIDTGIPEDARRAETLLTGFLKEEAAPLMPGIGELLEETRQAAVADDTGAAAETAFTDGRQEALEDILLFTQYLTSNYSGSAAEILARIRTKAAEDTRYAKAVREIQILADEGSSRAADAAGLVVSSQILGTVSQVSGMNLVVESLQSRELAAGTEISVRRKSRTRGEVLIGTGTITAVSGTRIEAVLKQQLTSSPVEITDLVYIAGD